MNDSVIAFLGCGNMGRSLIGGLITDGYPPTLIRAADPDAEQLARLGERAGVNGYTDNAEAARDAGVIVLAVKPQQVKSVATALRPEVAARRPLIVSIAAGIRTDDLVRWLGPLPVVRAMPNTPALLGCGATGLFARADVTAEQRERAESILRAAGLTVWVESEAQIDAVTALSGSGPAYFFLFMELLEDAGARLGLSRAQARLLTLQTALGSARMAMEASAEPGMLRAQVTSRGGTTERAVEVMQERGLGAIVEEALRAARARAQELAAQFGADI